MKSWKRWRGGKHLRKQNRNGTPGTGLDLGEGTEYGLPTQLNLFEQSEAKGAVPESDSMRGKSGADDSPQNREPTRGELPQGESPNEFVKLVGQIAKRLGKPTGT